MQHPTDLDFTGHSQIMYNILKMRMFQGAARIQERKVEEKGKTHQRTHRFLGSGTRKIIASMLLWCRVAFDEFDSHNMLLRKGLGVCVWVAVVVLSLLATTLLRFSVMMDAPKARSIKVRGISAYAKCQRGR
jgi:hypothetical protein